MTSFFEVKFFLTAFTEECLGKLVKFFCGRQNLDKYGEKDSDENDAPNEFWIYLQGRINQGYDVVFSQMLLSCCLRLFCTETSVLG